MFVKKSKTFDNNLNEGAFLSEIPKLGAMKQYLKEVQCPCAPLTVSETYQTLLRYTCK
jgi:hypothetical protein